MNKVRRLVKLGLLVVFSSYLAGCCIAPHGWGHERWGYERGGYDRGAYGDRR